jgi:transcriptional regulator with XRE-family HTH domain
MAYEEVAPSLLWLARDNAGLTQRELAQRAGVPQSMIAAYENGTRQPTIPTLFRLLRSAGQELQMHLTPLDPQDIANVAQESLRTPEEQEAWTHEQTRLALLP